MNNKTKNITLLIAIALTVLSFQVKAQNQGSVQTVLIGAKAYSTTAIVQVISPIMAVLNTQQLVFKYKATTSSSFWNYLTLPINGNNIVNATTDTLGVEFWNFRQRFGTPTTTIVEGHRHCSYVRLRNLTPNTHYTAEVSHKGYNLLGAYTPQTTLIETNIITVTFFTDGNGVAQTHPY